MIFNHYPKNAYRFDWTYKTLILLPSWHTALMFELNNQFTLNMSLYFGLRGRAARLTSQELRSRIRTSYEPGLYFLIAFWSHGKTPCSSGVRIAFWTQSLHFPQEYRQSNRLAPPSLNLTLSPCTPLLGPRFRTRTVDDSPPASLTTFAHFFFSLLRRQVVKARYWVCISATLPTSLSASLPFNDTC